MMRMSPWVPSWTAGRQRAGVYQSTLGGALDGIETQQKARAGVLECASVLVLILGMVNEAVPGADVKGRSEACLWVPQPAVLNSLLWSAIRLHAP